MKTLRRFPIICLALVLLAITGFCLVQGSAVLMVVAGTLAALSWYVTEGPRGRSIPRWASNGFVVVATAVMVWDLISRPGDVPGVLGRYAVWLTLIKLYERRTARDHGQLLSLSLLLMLIGSSQLPPLLFGIITLLYAGLGVYALVLFRLYIAHERHARARRGAELDVAGAVLPSLRPVRGPAVGGHLVGLASVVAVAGLVLSIAVFVVFPRSIGRGAFTPFSSQLSTVQVTGYTDRVNLLGSTRITPSPRVVGTVRLSDARESAIQAPGPLYLRGSALSVYRDRTWRKPTFGDRAMRSPDEGPLKFVDPVLFTDPVITQDYEFLRPTLTYFSLYLPVTFETTRARRIVRNARDQTLRSGSRSTGTRTYRVRSSPIPSPDLARTAAGPFNRASAGGDFYERSTSAAMRVLGLAKSIIERAGLPTVEPFDPEARSRWNQSVANAFVAYLNTSPFEYSLDLGDVRVGADDPIEHFLFVSQRGHCEYFASALVAMCHVVGIEARLVAGFVTSEFESDSEDYLIRESGAHAWGEVPVGGGRFMMIDPSPPGVIDGPTAPLSLAGRIGWFYEQVEGTWNDRFVAFDEMAQADLFEVIDETSSARLEGAIQAFRAWADRVNRAFSMGPAGYIWLGIVAFALLIAIIAIVQVVTRFRRISRVLRLRRTRRGVALRLSRQLGFYLDMLAVLKRAGLAKPSWQPPLAFADALAERDDALASRVRSVVDLYYEGRYGGRLLDAGEVERARRDVGALAEMLGVRVTDWLDDDAPFEPDVSAAQIDAVRRMLRERGAASVLDVGCGAGRVLAPLVAAGHELTGVDLRKDALEHCAKAVDDLGATCVLLPGRFPEQPPVGASFDAVLVLGNTIMTWADVDDAVTLLGAVRERLNPDGVLLIDDVAAWCWPEVAEGRWQAGLAEDGSAQIVWAPDDAVFTIRTGAAVDPDDWTLRPADRRLRLWTRGALRLAARSAGLSEVARDDEGNLIALGC